MNLLALKNGTRRFSLALRNSAKWPRVIGARQEAGCFINFCNGVKDPRSSHGRAR